MKEKIITFGEIMLRLSTPDYQTINQTNSFMANYGGGEANVAVSLAHMGHIAYFVTKVPANQLGDGAISHLRMNNVDTQYIAKGRENDNLGIYFLETGFGGRPSKVIYNRRHSAITCLEKEDFNIEEIFKDATWFHLSGITLALNKKVATFAIECAKYCYNHHIKVSFDFNYRSKLWTIDEAIPVYKEMIKYCNIVFGSLFDFKVILGIDADKSQDERDSVLNKAIEKYDLDYIFGTDRIVHSSSENSLSGYYYSKISHEKTSPIRFMIYDRIGGGDAFASGCIHGLIKDYSNPVYALNYGLYTSVLKHTISGDACLLSCDDIEKFMKNSSCEVQR